MTTMAAFGVFNVRSFGATGDGTTDDTAAIQAAFTAVQGNTTVYGGTVFFPPGLYLITTTVTVPAGDGAPLAVRGSGSSSTLLWAAQSNLLSWDGSSPVSELTVSGLCFASTRVAKASTSVALHFPQGVVKSTFQDLLFLGAGGVPGTSVTAVPLGTCIDGGVVTDTVTITNVVMWFLQGTGVRMGHGSEVRIIGGRIIGLAKRDDGSIGVHVTGNNGGVHIIGTDVIALQHGVVLDASNGAGSNREIFINQATMDSNQRGLSIYDNSYVSIAGCWAASSDYENIWVSPQSTGALLVIVGGTIFNAGALGGDPSSGQCNGITVNAGTFHITGTAIRYNKGNGVWVPNGSVSHYSVVGCQLFNNGAAVNLTGTSYLVTNNIFNDNASNGSAGPADSGAIVKMNVGFSAELGS